MCREKIWGQSLSIWVNIVWQTMGTVIDFLVKRWGHVINYCLMGTDAADAGDSH